MELLPGQHDRSYAAILHSGDGKSYQLSPLMKDQPEAYVRIRRVLEDRAGKSKPLKS
jgi:hypothetical protein